MSTHINLFKQDKGLEFYKHLAQLNQFVRMVMDSQNAKYYSNSTRDKYKKIYESLVVDIDKEEPNPLETYLLECNRTIYAAPNEELRKLYYRIRKINVTQGKELYFGIEAFMSQPGTLSWDRSNHIYNRMQHIIASGIFNYFLQNYKQGYVNLKGFVETNTHVKLCHCILRATSSFPPLHCTRLLLALHFPHSSLMFVWEPYVWRSLVKTRLDEVCMNYSLKIKQKL